MEFENLPGFTTLNYVLMHMHHLPMRSLLRGDQNPKGWSSFFQLSPVCRIFCESPLLCGIARGAQSMFCSAWSNRDVSSLTCLAWVAPTWVVPLLVALAVEILVQGKLLWCPNGKYFNFLGPWLPLYLLCLHLLIVLVQQGPPGLTNSNKFECINEVLCREGKIMLLGF